jgi:hypothetical protein
MNWLTIYSPVGPYDDLSFMLSAVVGSLEEHYIGHCSLTGYI